jgi:hypothetical protein
MAELSRAFANHGRVWRNWRAALRPLALPDAGANIARHVVDAVTRRTAIRGVPPPRSSLFARAKPRPESA